MPPKLCRILSRRSLDDVRWSEPDRHAPIARADREILDGLAADPPLQQIDLLFYRSIPDATSELAHLRAPRRDASDSACQIANMVDAQRRAAIREPRIECGHIGDDGFTHDVHNPCRSPVITATPACGLLAATCSASGHSAWVSGFA